MSDYLSKRLESSEQITLHTHTEVVALHGDHRLEAITLRNNETDQEERKETAALFLMIGAKPFTDWLSDTLKLDEKGFIATGPEAGAQQSRFASSAPGVFAIGDVRSGSVKRVASAVGEGSVVVSEVYQFLQSEE